MPQNRSNFTDAKATGSANEKPLTKRSIKECVKVLSVLTVDVRATRSATRTVLSQPTQDYQKRSLWIDLQHRVESFALESSASSAFLLSIFDEFVGDLYTFLRENNTTPDAKAKVLDAYVKRLADSSRDERISKTPDAELNSIESFLSAVRPPKQKPLMRLVSWFLSLFTSGGRSHGSSRGNSLASQTRSKDAAVNATSRLLKHLHTTDQREIFNTFSAEVEKVQNAMRQCKDSNQANNTKGPFHKTLEATHKNAMVLMNALREYKRSLDDKSGMLSRDA